MLTAVALTIPAIASGQQRRRMPAPEGEGPNDPTAGVRRVPAASQRFPFLGAWEGELNVTPPPGEQPAPVPIAMVFELLDSAKVQYAGATIFPGNARAPHLETTTSHGALEWQQRNNGRGTWTHTARLAT
jgi:hypothetical protein